MAEVAEVKLVLGASRPWLVRIWTTWSRSKPSARTSMKLHVIASFPRSLLVLHRRSGRMKALSTKAKPVGPRKVTRATPKNIVRWAGHVCTRGRRYAGASHSMPCDESLSGTLGIDGRWFCLRPSRRNLLA